MHFYYIDTNSGLKSTSGTQLKWHIFHILTSEDTCTCVNDLTDIKFVS